MLIDTHSHIDSKEFTENLIDVIKNAENAGVFSMVNAGIDLGSSKRGIEISEKHVGIWAAVGIHPHAAKSFNESSLMEIEYLASHPKVVAIGEVGLDFYRDYSPHDVQRVAFRKQLDLAKQLNLPVIIHIRAAREDAMKILQEEWTPYLRGIFHSFSGEIEDAKWGLEHGFYIGINGAITFKNFKKQDLIRSIPLEKMVVETDCPYITPEPYRGKRNEPAYVKHTAMKLAELKGTSFDKVQKITTTNAWSIFEIPSPPQTSLNLFPYKGLSQNFLRDGNIIRKTVSLLKPDNNVVIEIGPGKGALTRLIAEKCKKAYVVELDYDLARDLSEFSSEKIVVVKQDFLKFNIAGINKYEKQKPVVLGNIPYKITSPIMFHLVEGSYAISRCVLMMQREVGQRLVAQPGSRKYGIPSILVQLYFDIELAFHVSSNAFYPKPKVASVVVILEPLEHPRFHLNDYEFFNNIIKGAFNKRRKLLFNALKENPFMDIDRRNLEVAFKNIGMPMNIRPGKVSIEKYVELGNELREMC